MEKIVAPYWLSDPVYQTSSANSQHEGKNKPRREDVFLSTDATQTHQPAPEALPSLASVCLTADCHNLLFAVRLYLFLAAALVPSITRCTAKNADHHSPVAMVWRGLSKGSERRARGGGGNAAADGRRLGKLQPEVHQQRLFYSPVPDW